MFSQATGKAVVVYIHDRSFNSFADRIIKLSVNKTKWTPGLDFIIIPGASCSNAD